jgi:hypothetical protein
LSAGLQGTRKFGKARSTQPAAADDVAAEDAVSGQQALQCEGNRSPQAARSCHADLRWKSWVGKHNCGLISLLSENFPELRNTRS